MMTRPGQDEAGCFECGPTGVFRRESAWSASRPTAPTPTERSSSVVFIETPKQAPIVRPKMNARSPAMGPLTASQTAASQSVVQRSSVRNSRRNQEEHRDASGDQGDPDCPAAGIERAADEEDEPQIGEVKREHRQAHRHDDPRMLTQDAA